VNAPLSCWPDVIPKKKDKKRSKYVALDFSAHFLIFYFLIQKNKSKKKDKKRSKYV
jgi:hypothetical protein